MFLKNTLIATLALTLTVSTGIGQDAPSPQPLAPACFYTGEPAKPGVTIDYEGTTYAFSSEEKRTQFEEERAASLYQQIGGSAALTAAVDLFYVKVLADERVNHFFEDINMKTQNRKQKAFLAAALGVRYPGRARTCVRRTRNSTSGNPTSIRSPRIFRTRSPN